MSQPFNDHIPETIAFIALGANQPADIHLIYLRLKTCLQDFTTPGATIRRISRFYRTPCFPPGAGPDFVNAVAEIGTALPAGALLDHLHAIERRHGRVRTRRWGPRSLDIDLLACGEEIAPNLPTHAEWRDLPPEEQRLRTPAEMILPHPRLQDRGFVLAPWADIAPDWRHPVLARSVSEMLSAIDRREIERIIPLSQAEMG